MPGTASTVFLQHCTLAGKQKIPSSFKDFLDEAVKIIND